MLVGAFSEYVPFSALTDDPFDEIGYSTKGIDINLLLYCAFQTWSNIAYMFAPGRAHQPALAPVAHHAGDLRPGEAHGAAGGLHPQHGAAPQGGADQARAQDLAAGDRGLPRPAPPQVRYSWKRWSARLSHVSCLTTVCWQACERGWRDPGQRGAPQRQAEGGADRAPGDPQHGSSDARRLTIEI